MNKDWAVKKMIGKHPLTPQEKRVQKALRRNKKLQRYHRPRRKFFYISLAWMFILKLLNPFRYRLIYSSKTHSQPALFYLLDQSKKSPKLYMQLSRRITD